MQSVPIELLKATFDLTNDGVVICDYHSPEQHPIQFVNRSFETLSGFTQAELKGLDYSHLKSDENQQQTMADLKTALASGTECTLKLRTYTKSGRLFWNRVSIHFLREQDKITHIISVHQDISREEYTQCVLEKVNFLFREMSKRLEYTNETDKLTQLKNRGHLSTRGEFMLGAAKRERLRVHALVIDLDQFKQINGLGGDGLGDDCLIKLANILRVYFCRATDIAIRLCDDEFLVLCIEDDDERVLERACQLRQEVRDTRVKDFKNREHTISVSIGIYSLTPSKGTTIEEMVHQAGKLIFQGANGLRDCIVHQQAEHPETVKRL